MAAAPTPHLSLASPDGPPAGVRPTGEHNAASLARPGLQPSQPGARARALGHARVDDRGRERARSSRALLWFGGGGGGGGPPPPWWGAPGPVLVNNLPYADPSSLVW